MFIINRTYIVAIDMEESHLLSHNKWLDEIIELKSDIREFWFSLEQLKKDENALQQKTLDQRAIVKSAEEELE